MDERNVLGEPLEPCSDNPLTGFFRNGACMSGPDDVGQHLVCAEMTAEFLAFSKSRGNDLTTPMPQFSSPASSPATAGASSRRVGSRRSRPASRPA